MIMSVDSKEVLSAKADEADTFKTYNRRWGVLLALVLLNVSCGALWINCAPTATTVATYFDKSLTQINWFASMFFILAIPFTFVAAYFVDSLGLRVMLHIGAGLNLLGALIRAFATSGVIENKNYQYGISLFGQVFAGCANCFFLGIPTKISQKWFPESQRGLSTTIGSMSRPLGVIITNLSVPHIVYEPSDVPLNNYIWLGPAVLAEILTIVFITRSEPKTAPSRSAITGDEERPPFKAQLKEVFKCRSYILLNFVVGGGSGFVFMLGALTQQLICPHGYSEALAGGVNAIMLLAGFAGSALCSFFLRQNPDFTKIMKILTSFSSIFVILFTEFILIPGFPVLLCVSALLFGFAAVGSLPVGLELAVETTFPVEETISCSIIFLSAQLHGLIFVVLVPILASETRATTLDYCGTPTTLNYTLPLLLVMAYITFIGCTLIYFFDTEYKRQNADLVINRRRVSSYGSAKSRGHSIEGGHHRRLTLPEVTVAEFF